ncbi:C40 family peptidase [Arcanobacterium haemolyticum]|nr:C40 family peptidase [Arcanobacterium haemolyticum]
MGAKEDRQKIIRWFETHQEQYSYANVHNDNFDPDRHSSADCSDVVDAAYREVGIDLPGMSDEQAATGREVASGHTAADFAAIQDQLRQGDIIGMGMRAGRNGGRAVDHVEVYDRDGYSWGHGDENRPGPHRNRISTLLKLAGMWTARRHIEDDNNDTTIEGEDDMRIVSRTGDEAAFLVTPTACIQIDYAKAKALTAIGVPRFHASPQDVYLIQEAVHELADDEQQTQRAYDKARG